MYKNLLDNNLLDNNFINNNQIKTDFNEHPQLNSEIKKIEILSDIKYKLYFPK